MSSLRHGYIARVYKHKHAWICLEKRMYIYIYTHATDVSNPHTALMLRAVPAKMSKMRKSCNKTTQPKFRRSFQNMFLVYICGICSSNFNLDHWQAAPTEYCGHRYWSERIRNVYLQGLLKMAQERETQRQRHHKCSTFGPHKTPPKFFYLLENPKLCGTTQLNSSCYWWFRY